MYKVFVVGYFSVEVEADTIAEAQEKAVREVSHSIEYPRYNDYFLYCELDNEVPIEKLKE